jgi:F-type H+-transporting ATPase subunit alpha
MEVWEMASVLFTVNNNYMDDVPVNKVSVFERGLRDYLRTKHAALTQAMETGADLTKESEAELRGAIESYKKTAAF